MSLSPPGIALRELCQVCSTASISQNGALLGRSMNYQNVRFDGSRIVLGRHQGGHFTQLCRLEPWRYEMSAVTDFPEVVEVEILDPQGNPVPASDGDGNAAIVITRQVSKLKFNPNSGEQTGGGNAFYSFDASRGGLDLPAGLDQMFRFNGTVCEMGEVKTSEAGNLYRTGNSTVTVNEVAYQFKVVIIEGKRPHGLAVSLTKKPQNSGANLKPRGGVVKL
jgi:hypothetical protein